MTEQSGFADLGLENPGSYELPTFGLPEGDHYAFIKTAEFVANKQDSTKKNLHVVYEVNEPGSPAFGKTADEYKPVNATDDAKTKGYLVDWFMGVEVAPEELPTYNIQNLVGMPVIISVRRDYKNPRQTRVQRVVKNTDGQHVNVPAGAQPPVAGTNTGPAVTTSVDY